MKGMNTEQALSWCKSAGLTMDEDGILSYDNPNQRRFFIAAPETFRGMMAVSRAIIVFGGEAGFHGGLLWLHRWDIGSPQSVRVGWQIMEDMRRARGDVQSLDIAPAQSFRHDEFVPLHAFLLNVIGLGLVADFVSSSRHFFAHFKDNEQICFSTDEVDTFKELQKHFSSWNPTDEDPMILKLRELERRHQQDSQ